MENFVPNIEVLTDRRASPPYLHQKPWYLSQRFIIFVVTFLITAISSLAYVYSRPAIYSSSAKLLTSEMTAIDEQSSKADVQQVAIQKQILLGQELLTETLARLSELTDSPSAQMTLPQIQNVLAVEPVKETNMVEIRAEGADPNFLPLLINTWIDVYLDARKSDVQKQTTDTTELIESELKELESKVKVKRAEIEAFRLKNNILSIGRDENEALARLKGLNDSLNKANEEEVKAKANLDAVKLAISEGRPIVPQQDQGVLQNLEKRRQELNEKQAKLEEKFTQDYINLQPALKIVPEEIKKLEKEIQKTLNYGKNVMLSEAKKEYAASQQTIKVIREQMESHKKEAATFTTLFAQHETLLADLEGLEKLYRETQERLVHIQTRHKEKYPQVTVIDRANLPGNPVRPHYQRDALIATSGSLFLGLLSVWMVGYLTKKQEQPMPSTVILSGMPLTRREYDPALSRRSTDLISEQPEHKSLPLKQQTTVSLTGPKAREMSSYELDLLLNHANLKGKQLISCLLSGLSPEETTGLKADQINFDTNTIQVGESVPRILPLHNALKKLFEQSEGHPAWANGVVMTTNILKSELYFAAIDSGLPHPEEITAGAIRHSYIAFLVRQGLSLSYLDTIVGPLDPEMVAGYSSFAPPDRGHTVDKIELLHPALHDLIV